jgi:hypothetical protein
MEDTMEQVIYFNPADNLTSGIEEIQTTWEIVDSFYVKTSRGLVCKAYVYPAQYRRKLEELFSEYRAAKQAYDDTAARIFYQELPKLV